jgi:hypothetical protein
MPQGPLTILMSPEKSRAFKFFDRVPVVRDTGDPEYAGILLLFVCSVGVALLILGGGSDAYTHVLQTAGGVLVVLGLYLTGVNLRTARSEQYAGRLMTAIAQLASESEAVRIGTIRLLEAMLIEAPNVTTEDRIRVERYKTAVVDALNSLGGESDTPAALLARQVSASVASTQDVRGLPEIEFNL